MSLNVLEFDDQVQAALKNAGRVNHLLMGWKLVAH